MKPSNYAIVLSLTQRIYRFIIGVQDQTMSTPITTLAVAAMISLTGWQPAVAAEHGHEKDSHASQLLGAWSQISIDEEVMNVAYFSANILSDSQLKNVLSAKQQLVAGINYALLLEMNNEHRWEVIVYRDLDNIYHLISSKQLP